VDLPGFGLSGDPGRVLDVTEHADHLADWLQAADLSPVAVLGNSFGCQVAVELAVRHPDQVRGLVLVGPTMDLAARTAPRQILRWPRDTAREDPLQLPMLLRDVRDAGCTGSSAPCSTPSAPAVTPVTTPTDDLSGTHRDPDLLS
jgi:pimeloyl-ACP methyl ester carboxylesterase